jgi:autotransporter-associated beta strand protein
LRLEPLEDRTTPATLDLTGAGTFTYTAGVGVANNLTLSTDGATYTLTDTAETITLNAAAIAAGWSGSGTNSVTGPNASVLQWLLDTGDEDDTVQVLSLAHLASIDTGSGSNSVTLGGLAGVGAQAISSDVDVVSTGGGVSLVIDDAANAGATVFNITAMQVEFLTPGLLSYADLDALTVRGGSGGNVINFEDTPAGITTTLEAGAGNDFVSVLASTGPLNYVAVGGTDTVILSDAGITDFLAGAVNLTGGGGVIDLIVDGSASFDDQTASLSATGLTGLTAGGVTWTAGALASLSVNTGFGDDTVTVVNTPAGIVTTLLVGEGDDTVTVQAVDGPLDVDGNLGDDTYNISPGAWSGALTLSDSGGNDTLNFSDSAVGVTINMDSTAVQPIGAGTLQITGVSIIENFIGSTFDDTISVRPLLNTPRFIDGNNPVLPTVPGDVLNLNNTPPPALVDQTLTLTGPGAGEFTAPLYGTITYTSIETFNSTFAIPNVVINASPTVRDFRLVRSGMNLEVYDITSDPTGVAGSLFFSGSYASLLSLTINGTSAEDNRVVVDFGAGDTPIPTNGFTFNGKAVANGPSAGTIDRLDFADFSGSSIVSAATVAYTGAEAGTVSLTPALGTVTFTQVDGLDLGGGALTSLAGTLSIPTLNFDFSALSGPTTATFAAAVGAGSVQQVATTSGPTQFAATRFGNPATLLTVDTTGATPDTIALGAMAAGFTPVELAFTGSGTADVYQLTSTEFLQTPAPGLTLTTATFALNGTSDTLAWLQDSNDGTSQLLLNGGATLTTGDATNRVYNGVIAGNGNLIKQGSGDWTLGGSVANTQTGTTTVNEGTLLLNKSGVFAVGDLIIGDGVGGNDADIVRLLQPNQIQNGATVTVRTTGLLELNGQDDDFTNLIMESGDTFAGTVTTGVSPARLNMLGSVTLNATGTGATPADINGRLRLNTGARTFTVANGTPSLTDTDLLINAEVFGPGGFVKDGPGLVQLTAINNTYSGETIINQGTFHLTGILTGAGLGVTLNGPDVVFSGGGTGQLTGAGRTTTVNGTTSNGEIINLALIQNTTAGTTGVNILNGASVRVLNNTINATGNTNSNNLRVDGATLLLQGNTLNGSGQSVGLRISGGAIVDAGQVSGGFDFTGLNGGGVGNGSTGGNSFLNFSTSAPAIRNLNTNGLNALAGPHGAPVDTYAQNNTFNALAQDDYPGIEALVDHDFDNPAVGFVNYITPASATPELVVDADGDILLYSVTPTAAANNNWLQRSMIRRARISFTDFVFIQNGALSVERISGLYNATGGTHNGAITTSRVGPVLFDPFSTTGRYFNYEFGFSGSGVEVSGSLVDGAYTMTLTNAGIQAYVEPPPSVPSLQVNGGSGSTTINFHRLFGDVDGNGVTNNADRTAFLAAMRSTFRSANYREYFDFDNDRDVDGADQNQFNIRWNRY